MCRLVLHCAGVHQSSQFIKRSALMCRFVLHCAGSASKFSIYIAVSANVQSCLTLLNFSNRCKVPNLYSVLCDELENSLSDTSSVLASNHCS